MLSQETVKLKDSIIPQDGNGGLSGGIAHDCNNILTGILGHGELALLKLTDANPARDHLRIVLAGCLRVQDLLRQNTVTGLVASQEWKPFQLRGVIEELLWLLNPILRPHTRVYLNLGCFSSTVLADQS